MQSRILTAIPFLKSAFVICVLVLCTACSGSSSSQQESSTNTATAAQAYAIVYAQPDRHVPEALVQSVASLHASGEIPYALHLENTGPSAKAGFSSAFILGFKSGRAFEAWRQANAALLESSVEVLQVDRLFHEENPVRDSSVAVFQGNFMQPKVERAQFASFSRRYMHKYMELQRQAGILTSYAMYQAHSSPGGEQGLAFMMREHTNQSIFDNRNPPKDRLRDELMARDADYRQLEDTAIEYRIHLNSTTARSVPIAQ